MITLYRDNLSGDIGFEVLRYTESGKEMVHLQVDYSTIRPVEVPDLEPVSREEAIEYLNDLMESTVLFAAEVGFIVNISISDA